MDRATGHYLWEKEVMKPEDEAQGVDIVLFGQVGRGTREAVHRLFWRHRPLISVILEARGVDISSSLDR